MRFLLGWLIALMLALPAACGGDDDPSQEEEEIIITRGDGLCADAQRRFDAIQTTRPRSASAAAELTARLSEALREQVEGLERLAKRAPEGMDRALEEYISALRAAELRLQETHDAALADQPAAYNRARRSYGAMVPPAAGWLRGLASKSVLSRAPIVTRKGTAIPPIRPSASSPRHLT